MLGRSEATSVAGRKAKIISPGKRTVVAVGRKMSEAFVPGWDKEAGNAQHRERLDQRLAMGQKMTPNCSKNLVGS